MILVDVRFRYIKFHESEMASIGARKRSTAG
ncbi:hypothetical protein [Microcystis phage Mvi-JY20]|uniref:Uncharacterized protein n=1 Tax=Microcystis phage Mvi-JY20 TaxID=3128146 RepID=A0AAX4QII7_9CAUD